AEAIEGPYPQAVAAWLQARGVPHAQERLIHRLRAGVRDGGPRRGVVAWAEVERVVGEVVDIGGADDLQRLPSGDAVGGGWRLHSRDVFALVDVTAIFARRADDAVRRRPGAVRLRHICADHHISGTGRHKLRRELAIDFAHLRLLMLVIGPGRQVDTRDEDILHHAMHG